MKKNVMFIVPKLIGGGAEKTVANLSLFLNQEKYNIYIVIFRDTKTKYEFSGELIKLSDRENNTIMGKILYTFKLVRELKKIKKDKHIDCAISFLTYADILNSLSKGNELNMCSIRNMDSILLNNFLLFNMTKYACKKADYIISISNKVKDDLQSRFKIDKNKIQTIYNPSIITKFGDNKIKFEIFDDFIVTMGRLNNQKGQWHLIRAFSEVHKKIPTLKLLILGDGELKPYLEKLIVDFSLSESVKLCGFVDNPYDYVRSAKAFVFPSLYEGLGNSILESLACGTPVISTDCDAGPREILAPDTDYRNKNKDIVELAKYGILTPCFDGIKYDASHALSKEEKLFAEAIIKLITNCDLLESYKCKSIICSQKYDIQNIVNQWEMLIDDKIQ